LTRKKRRSLFDWADDHPGISFLFIIGTIFALVATGIILYEIHANDFVIYEDNVVICYNDEGANDPPNTKQELYCVNKASGKVSCEYNYSRGSGNKPPQGCYL
jgi:hypothetical protein